MQVLSSMWEWSTEAASSAWPATPSLPSLPALPTIPHWPAYEWPDYEWTPLEAVVSPSCIIWLVVVVSVVRFLRLLQAPMRPQVTLREKSSSTNMKQLVADIDMLSQEYRPPPLWGKSGHVQTAAYGLLGHATLKRTADRREAVKLPDGATVTFDVWEPLCKHPSGQDVTLALTPGICNSSESNYIRTAVHYAQERGYRCAVLNHLGALADVPLSSPRIFSYGGTDELYAMMMHLMQAHPQTRFINVGFSMGANITTQFILRLEPELRHRIVVGLSVGQGYSANVSAPMYHDWENGRRFYNYVITENMKRLLRRHYSTAVEPHVKSGLVDEQRLWSSTSIIAFDEQYNRRVTGFSCLDSFYTWCSCLPELPRLRVPMVFLNAEDDPIVPEALWRPVQELCEQQEEMCFVLTRHGGHLGFLEGGSFSPHSVTWLDRFIVALADSALSVY